MRRGAQLFANILSAFGWGQASTYQELPYLAARLFKLAQWQSVPQEEVFKVLHLLWHYRNAVTHCAGQGYSRVAEQGAGEDPARVRRQATASHAAGGATRPDSKPAAVFPPAVPVRWGLSFLGRDHTYCPR